METKPISDDDPPPTERVIVVNCNRDHRTSEERAVVEAAVARRKLELRPARTANVDGGDYEIAMIMERDAVDKLLAARSKSEVQYPVRDEK